MVTKLFDVNALSTDAMLAILDIMDEVEEEEKIDALSRLVEKTILIEAKKRRGKSLTAMALGYELRERFQRPVIVIASNMGLNEKFGPFQFLSAEQFREQLDKISELVDSGKAEQLSVEQQVARAQNNAELIIEAFKKLGINLMYATAIFDEARKLFNKRSPMDKLCQLFADYLMQSAHYHTTNILTAPEEADIDRRVCKQIDWRGRVYHNKYTGIARCRFTMGVETLVYEVNGPSDSEHVPFYSMYDSWSLLGYRPRQLSIKQM